MAFLAFGSSSTAFGSAPAPKSAKPLTVLYTGSFVMKNQATPESTAHSYTFTVTWRYWWTGTWGSLFTDHTVFSSPASKFTKVKIDGKVDSTYKERVDDPDSAIKKCHSTVGRDAKSRPTMRAAYDTAADTLQVIVEAPTFRGIKYGTADLNCQDGPGTNVFGQGASLTPPRAFNPLGSGGTVRLSKGGTARYDRTWKWQHTFASASNPTPYRDYKATMRSAVTVWYVPCKLIKECAGAKP